MRRPVRMATIVLATSLSAVLAGISCAHAESSVGWALAVTNADILSRIDAGVVEEYAMEVRDGALRLTYDPQKNTGPVSFNLNFPEPFDLKDCPIPEVKWDRGPSAQMAPPEPETPV